MAKQITGLDLVTLASKNEGMARTACIKAVQDNGGDTPEVRAAYIIGRLSHSLGYSVGDARLCLDKAGATAKLDGPKRTEKEEKAYGAARVAWDSIKRAAGLAASPTKSKARNGKGKVARVDTVAPDEVTFPSPPKVQAEKSIGAHAMALSAHMRKFRSLNSASFKGDDGSALASAYDAFIASVEAVCVKK